MHSLDDRVSHVFVKGSRLKCVLETSTQALSQTPLLPKNVIEKWEVGLK